METTQIEKNLPWDENYDTPFLPEDFVVPLNLGEEEEPYPYEYELALKATFISNLEELTGEEYVKISTGEDEDFIPNGYWKDSNRPGFIDAIISSKRGQQALEFIDFELQELTLKIKDNPLSNGRIKPIIHYMAIVEDWDGDEGLQARYQILERDREFREWVVDFKQKLFLRTHMIKKSPSSRFNAPEPPSITFEKLFGDYDIIKQKSPNCRKLTEILKSEDIQWARENGEWAGNQKELIILYKFLDKNNYFKTADNLKSEGYLVKGKLSQQDICDLLSDHFSVVKIGSQHFSTTSKEINGKSKLDPSIISKCNLTIRQLKQA